MSFCRVSRGDEPLYPRPTKEAIATAETKIQDVYKDDLAKARKPKEKAAIAAVLLKAADSVGSDDAARFVLLAMAKDLSIDASDAGLAMQAITSIVQRYQPDGPTETKEQIDLGNTSWKASETAPAEKRLRLQVQAAEWYLRAKPTATGLDEILIQKRLTGLQSAKNSTDATVTVVAMWAHHAKPRNREVVSSTTTLYADGHFIAPEIPGGPAKWEKHGSELILHWGNGNIDVCTISKDGRSYEGYNKQNPRTRLWGTLLSEHTMPK
jgi:hypothetical protein